MKKSRALAKSAEASAAMAEHIAQIERGIAALDRRMKHLEAALIATGAIKTADDKPSPK